MVDVNRVSEPEGRVRWAASPDVVRQFPSKPGARGPRAGRRSPLRPRGASWATVPQAAPKMDTSSPPAGVSHRLEAGDGLRHCARPAQTHPSAGSAAGRADVELLTRTGGAGSFVGQVAPCGVTAFVTARCGTKDLSRPRPPVLGLLHQLLRADLRVNLARRLAPIGVGEASDVSEGLRHLAARAVRPTPRSDHPPVTGLEPRARAAGSSAVAGRIGRCGARPRRPGA